MPLIRLPKLIWVNEPWANGQVSFLTVAQNLRYTIQASEKGARVIEYFNDESNMTDCSAKNIIQAEQLAKIILVNKLKQHGIRMETCGGLTIHRSQ